MNNPENSDSEAIEVWTVPDSICMFRIVGSVGLIGIAIAHAPIWFVGIYGVLAISDLIDGPIARVFEQQTKFGAKLDSLADIMLTVSLIIGSAILCSDTLNNELFYIVGAIVSYVGAAGFGWWKYQKFPSYHTWTAKLTHFLVVLAGISLILEWSVFPLRIAAGSAMIANLESIFITAKSAVWLSDVPSVFRMPPDDSNNN